ncbi:hypothetical protein [Paraburkholderia sp. J8-2]|uniref:hypothetical protein n=1 Tax=Paraburkholderia sp. J8-2 TaxID=2805440 RepID=UPI002AB6EFC4|nr:hypothetical protein [Paraburkholderia sp. J8-2]
MDTQQLNSEVEAGVSVSVVARKDKGVASFDWFYSPSAAEVAFQESKLDCETRHPNGTMVVLCEVLVSSLETATGEIESRVEELFLAPNVFPAPDSRLKYVPGTIH